MELQLLIDGTEYAHAFYYPRYPELIKQYRVLSPGQQIDFICDLIYEINAESDYICHNLLADWAGHNHEESEKAINILKKLIARYDERKELNFENNKTTKKV